jgi:hypothetical protein
MMIRNLKHLFLSILFLLSITLAQNEIDPHYQPERYLWLYPDGRIYKKPEVLYGIVISDCDGYFHTSQCTTWISQLIIKGDDYIDPILYPVAHEPGMDGSVPKYQWYYTRATIGDVSIPFYRGDTMGIEWKNLFRDIKPKIFNCTYIFFQEPIIGVDFIHVEIPDLPSKVDNNVRRHTTPHIAGNFSESDGVVFNLQGQIITQCMPSEPYEHSKRTGASGFQIIVPKKGTPSSLIIK